MRCFTRLKRFFRELFFPPGTTPVSLMLLFTLGLATFSYSMVMTTPFSYLPSMVKSFGYSEKNVGRYAGMIAASYYAGQILTSYFWGWLCDRIGGKKSHLITTILLLIMTIVFGLSKNIQWAIGARLTQGIVGAILITGKSIIFKLCDKTNNGIAFAILMMSYAIGMVIGPALGGYLAYPCKQYPDLCTKRSILESYPFLLPNLICSSCLLSTVFLSYVFIPKPTRSKSSSEAESNNPKQETSTKSQRTMKVPVYDAAVSEKCYTVISKESSSESGEGEGEGDRLIQPVSESPVEDIDCKPTNGKRTACWRSFKQSSFFQLMRLRIVVVTLGFFSSTSFVSVGFDEIYPVFADSPQRYGGLQFSADEIGRSLLLAAIPLIFLVFALPKLNRKFGNMKLITWSYYLLIFCTPLFPYLALINKRNVWFALVPSFCFMRFLAGINLFCINLLLNNATPYHFIGAVNGLSMTISCAFRTLSPGTLGPLYTWSLGNEGRIGYPFNHCFSFVLMGFVCLLALVFAIWIPTEHLRNTTRI